MIKRKPTELDITSKAIARICLNCPLPSKACNKGVCARFEEEKKKIKDKLEKEKARGKK